MKRSPMHALRTSGVALFLGVLAWASGCATGPKPLVEPAFQARSYTPARIALLPPELFLVYDEVGDNDPQKSAALGKAVSEQVAKLVGEGLRRRGYDVALTAGWDGIRGPDGQLLVGGNELSLFASSVLQFANSPSGGAEGPAKAPSFIAPEVAARLGWAANADALLYLNLKGVAVSQGKRTAQVLGVTFAVVVVAAIILLLIAESQGGGGKSSGGRDAFRGGGGGGNVARAAPPPGGAAFRGSPSGAGAPTTARLADGPPVGRGRAPSRGGGRTYRSHSSSSVSLGVGVMVPLDGGGPSEPVGPVGPVDRPPPAVPLEGPIHTHGGQLAAEDELFAGDDVYFTMTLVSAVDGRVLWHLRDNVDVEADDPADVARFIDRTLASLPPSLALAPPGPVPPGAPAPSGGTPAPPPSGAAPPAPPAAPPAAPAGAAPPTR